MSKIGIQIRGSGAVMRKYLRGGGLAKRGTGVALKGGGRAAKFGGGRTNLLEELGRVEAERSNPNRRAEISRVHGELNRGYNKGGKVFTVTETMKGKPHWTQEGQDASIKRKFKRKSDAHQQGLKAKREDKAEGGRAGFRNGGSSMQHHYLQHGYGPHKKRKGKAIGGVIKGGKRFLDFIKTGKHVDKKGVKTNVPKAAERLTGKPHVDRVKKAVGGRIGLKHGFQVLGGGVEGKPHSTYEGRNEEGRRRFKRLIGEDPGKRNRDFVKRARRMARAGRGKDFKTHGRDVPTMAATGGRIGLKKGGSDKNWIQKATASIKKRGTKGKCTPITKPGCTGRAKALALTFKKMARKRKKS